MTFIGAKIGDVTYVRPNHSRLHCGPNVAKLTPHKCISTLYFVKVLQSSLIQRQIEEITKSTAQPSLSMKTIRQLKLPVPPLSEQQQIVAYMDKLQAKVDALERLQTETTAEIVALLPSILDKAFKGGL
jgi:type I restriction enzyme S subunit